MVRPPRTNETLDAQKSIDKARELLGSPSSPPDEFEAQEELTQPGFPRAEMTTHGGRKGSLTEVTIGEVSEQARSFKNEYLRLVFLAIVIAAAIYCLASGIVTIGRPH